MVTNGYPRKMEVGLIGSCTNSSYQDLSRAVSIARQVTEKHLAVAAPLIVNPGSEQIRATAERDGMIDAVRKDWSYDYGECLRSVHRTVETPYR